MKAGSHDVRRPDPKVWADPPAYVVAGLIADSRKRGWRDALEQLREQAPFFVRRMHNLRLGNWHTLFGLKRESSVLDVGTGFGSMVLGLGKRYRIAAGVDMLPERVEYAALRAAQDGLRNSLFGRAAAHHLPFQDNCFDLVTLNGVLEWASLHDQHRSPHRAQLEMLEEARRVLSPGGRVAVAIENRFALETFLAMRDTHTHMLFVPVLPRWFADIASRIRCGQRYTTYLHSRRGYVRLLRRAGLARVRVFDLISSYNDYDFVLESTDRLSYQYLYRHTLVRHFYSPAGTARTLVSRIWPARLGALSYAYLVVGGSSVVTLIDADHPMWSVVRPLGLTPGPARFMCNGTRVGTLAIAVHDGKSLLGLLELTGDPPEKCPRSVLDERLRQRWEPAIREIGATAFQELTLRVFLPA